MLLHKVHKTDKVWVEFAAVAALDYGSAAAGILWESRVEGSDSQVEHVWVDHFLLQGECKESYNSDISLVQEVHICGYMDVKRSVFNP